MLVFSPFFHEQKIISLAVRVSFFFSLNMVVATSIRAWSHIIKNWCAWNVDFFMFHITCGNSAWIVNNTISKVKSTKFDERIDYFIHQFDEEKINSELSVTISHYFNICCTTHVDFLSKKCYKNIRKKCGNLCDSEKYMYFFQCFCKSGWLIQISMRQLVIKEIRINRVVVQNPSSTIINELKRNLLKISSLWTNKDRIRTEGLNMKFFISFD